MRKQQSDWLHKSILCNPKGRRTFLGFHGFGGSPFDYKPLSDQLIRHDFRIVLPKVEDSRLAKVADGTLSLDNWMKPYQDILAEELRRDPNLCLAGFSMGGSLCSILAQKFPVSQLLLLGHS